MLFSLSLLALGLSTVFAAPTPSLVRRGGDATCPYKAGAVHSITLDGDIHSTIKIKFLGSGGFGCAYDVVEPFVLPTGQAVHAVAKTPRTDRGMELEADEIAALHSINEFYGEGSEKNGREWMLMKYHSGVRILDTAGWKSKFPENYNKDTSAAGIADCEAFMKGIYDLVAKEIQRYAKSYGWEPDDDNWTNFLFNEQLTRVEIIDWGLSEKVDQSKSFETYNKYMKLFQTHSILPIRDIYRGSYVVQGICQSNERQTGQPFKNPMLSSSWS